MRFNFTGGRKHRRSYDSAFNFFCCRFALGGYPREAVWIKNCEDGVANLLSLIFVSRKN